MRAATGRAAAAASTPARRAAVAPTPSPAAPPSWSRRHSIATAAVRKTGAKQVVCSKTLVAKPGEEDAVAAACADLVAKAGPSPADGVLEFAVSRDPAEPAVFHFWERYASNVALGRHNARPDVVAWMEGVVPRLEGPVGMVLYEWRDGALSNACQQGGPKGEGGLDDATGGSGMAGGAGLKQTSGTVELGVKDEVEEEEKKESVSIYICVDEGERWGVERGVGGGG